MSQRYPLGRRAGGRAGRPPALSRLTAAIAEFEVLADQGDVGGATRVALQVALVGRWRSATAAIFPDQGDVADAAQVALSRRRSAEDDDEVGREQHVVAADVEVDERVARDRGG